MRRLHPLPGLLLLAAVAVAGEPHDPVSPAEECNAFGFRLHRALARPGENLVFSPWSVATALAMAREGAEAETARGMDAVLGVRGGSGLAAAMEPPTAGHGEERGPAYRLRIANAVWAQDGVAFRDTFTEALRAGWGAPLRRIDFGDPARAREAVNGWVADRTDGRIEALVPPGLPEPDTRLALVNALHFVGQWHEPFREDATTDALFHAPDGDVRVPTMRREGRFGHAAIDGARLVEVPYRDAHASMVVALPGEGETLADLERRLDGARLARWTGALERRRVELRLPRFGFSASRELSGTLASMGMERAFDPRRAEFGGMTTEIPLCLGLVLHQATVSVDEKGTEAAAATAVLMKLGAAADPDPPVLFAVDRPFLFLIRHRATGCVLFLGRVCRP